MVSVPAPRMSAPAALSMAARSATSGSAAAPRMTVVPSASAAAVINECVAPTEGKRSDMSALPRRGAVDRHAPSASSSSPTAVVAMTVPSSVTRTRAPSASKPRRCRSTGRAPMAHPPGSGISTRPVRASIGPAAKNDARSFETVSIVNALVVILEQSTRRVPSTPPARSSGESFGRVTFAPTDSSTAIIELTSLKSGTFVSVTGSEHASVPARSASTAFFAPPTRTKPESRASPSTARYPPPPAPDARAAGADEGA